MRASKWDAAWEAYLKAGGLRGAILFGKVMGMAARTATQTFIVVLRTMGVV
jgi:hypothetical protein